MSFTVNIQSDITSYIYYILIHLYIYSYYSREVVYNMRISAGGAREAGKRRRNST